MYMMLMSESVCVYLCVCACYFTCDMFVSVNGCVQVVRVFICADGASVYLC